MNNPSDVKIDIAEQRRWLLQHKADNKNLSWNRLGGLMDVNGSTLSLFGTDNYKKGDNEKIATAVFRYRQTLFAQQRMRGEAPEIPSFFPTKTADDIMSLLGWCQGAKRGRIGVFAGGPGTQKTMTAKEYQARASAVWIVTVTPAITSVKQLLTEVIRSLGLTGTGGSVDWLARRVIERLKDSQGLLIFDEAQLMSIEMIEMVRALYDASEVGVALLGNERVISRMEGGTRQAAFAQLYSRIGMSLSRPVPLREDIEALADAWQIHDEAQFALLLDVGTRPGGMRSCTFILEVAHIFASGEASDLTLKHLHAARIQLGNRVAA